MVVFQNMIMNRGGGGRESSDTYRYRILTGTVSTPRVTGALRNDWLPPFVISSSCHFSVALSFLAEREAGSFFSSSSAARALIALPQEWRALKCNRPVSCFRRKASRTTSY